MQLLGNYEVVVGLMGVEPTSRALKVRCITVLLQPIQGDTP